ncbi:hypothetical protein SAMN05216268_11182 [Streptomyces yunnanensis]|uniref:Uncharacterized protein n=1 Tax=Streptomyces yunnanensis TaxID=156453 RepID=A0A9X8MZP9_9ACTN|nr:hypothetical protein SAMN05216268_11182 [Streptomyces yunnanensis]
MVNSESRHATGGVMMELTRGAATVATVQDAGYCFTQRLVRRAKS